MTDRTPSNPTSADAAALRTAHCRRCRYALRGLDVTGPCPECGLPIARTLTVAAAAPLTPAEAAAVRRIARLSLAGLGVHVVAHLLSTSPPPLALAVFATATALSLLAIVLCGRLWRSGDRVRRSGALHAWGGFNLLLLLFAGAYVLAILTAFALVGPALA